MSALQRSEMFIASNHWSVLAYRTGDIAINMSLLRSADVPNGSAL
jgi:hypothetical protein